MPAHRQALPTPRGDGKSDPKGRCCEASGRRRAPFVVGWHHGLPSPKRSSGFAQAGATRS